MIDLNKIVNDSLVELEKEGFVEKVVKERIGETIKKIVDDVFRSYGDFGKNLESHIKENLNVNFKNLKLEGYNALVLTAIKEQLDATITTQGIERIKVDTEMILSDVKKEYTLSEIIEELKKESSKEEWEYDEDDKICLEINGNEGEYVHIYLDTEEHSYNHQYRYQIDMSDKGIPYSLEIDNKSIDTKKILGGLYGLNRLFFKIYSAGAKVVLDQGYDPDDYDLYYKYED